MTLYPLCVEKEKNSEEEIRQKGCEKEVGEKEAREEENGEEEIAT